MSSLVLVPPDRLRERVQQLGHEVSAAYTGEVVVLSVLSGSVVFLADLVRAMPGAVTVDFLAVSPYAPGTGRVRLVKDLDLDLADRHVVVVHDVVDTGLTITWLLEELGRRGPRSLDVCALVDRRSRRLVPVPLRWVGFALDDQFVLGYGLGYQGRYRNLDLLAAGDLEALRADPDAHTAVLYPSSAGGDPSRVAVDPRR